jgi:hypothetical protein
MGIVAATIVKIGVNRVAERAGKFPSAITKWRKQDCLPRTDLAGLTTYAAMLSDLSQDTDSPVTAEQLLTHSRSVWVKRRQLTAA